MPPSLAAHCLRRRPRSQRTARQLRVLSDVVGLLCSVVASRIPLVGLP